MPDEGGRKGERWRQKRRWIPGVLLLLLVVVSLLTLVIAVPPAVTRASRTDIQTASATDQLKAENDLRTTVVTMLAGFAVATGTVVAALNFRETQRQNRKSSELQRRGQVTEQFSKAIDQLGSDKLDVRIGGIYALEQIARDSPELHWPIVEILTAFIREHAKPDVTAPVGADIQAALTVLGRRNLIRDQGPVDLGRVSLQGARLREANFQGAHLFEVNLQGAHLFEVNLQGAGLFGANLKGATLFLVNLERASLAEANLERVSLGQVNLKGATLFRANLQGAQIGGVNLEDARLAETNLQGAYLRGVDLKGLDLSKVVGLTQEQLDSAICDEETKPPPGLTIKRADADATNSR